MRILIVGLGVIGASFAKGFKELGYNEVYGVDISKETLKKAKDLGIIKEGFLEESEIVKECELIILAIYPKLIFKFIEKNKDKFREGTVITDVTGIKEVFIDKIRTILPKSVDFIFGHPMAGKEKRGIDFSSNEVFKGANYIITPVDENKEKNIQCIEKIALELGFKNIKRISPSYHDKMIAFTSQLPHAIAVALINSDEEDRDTGSFIGDSYRDLTRIANINELLWSELFLGNRENLLECIENFEEELNIIKTAIKYNDKDALIKGFNKSSKRRENL
ncbi:prephenate dehydrogenase [uncultured Clostridium sp.]|uniref:prephenate dehydrogenase n=1 Tax=uncultured Clostridium sp. TaxID=59620 RepID=UPI00260ED453|nr:prephenate dehydrogenase [uncultured Clostridium sp.]